MSSETKISNFWLYTFMVCLLVFGTIFTFILKLQNETYDPNIGTNPAGRYYDHPYFQSMTLFLGEFSCLIPYLLQKKWFKQKIRAEQAAAVAKGLKLDFNKFLFLIPASFDLIGSTLMMYGYLLTAPSVYQMIRGGTVIFTALFSVMFLHRKLFRHHLVGLLFVIVGIVVVGLVSVIQKDSSTFKGTTIWGIVLLIGSFIFASGQMVVEEKLLGDFYIAPIQAIGLEGLFGTTYFIILLPIFNFIPCHKTIISSEGDRHHYNCPFGRVESSVAAFEQMGHSGLLLFYVVFAIVGVGLYNFSGISVTKYGSATARTTIDTSKTALVWIISLIISWERFHVLQLLGFILLSFGTLLFNEIISLPFCAFNKYTANPTRKRMEQAALLHDLQESPTQNSPFQQSNIKNHPSLNLNLNKSSHNHNNNQN